MFPHDYFKKTSAHDRVKFCV